MTMTRGRVVRYFLAVIAVAFALRLPSFLVSFVNIDENEYALAAHIINNGGIPYKDFLIYQPPVIYYLYAVTFQFFSHLTMQDKMWWVHFVMILVVVATCWAIYRTSKLVYEDRTTSFMAALFYAVFSTSFLPQDMLGANIELVMVLPMTLAIYFLLKGERCFYFYFVSGVFVGLSILTKYQGGILLAPIGIYLFFLRPFRKGFLPLGALLAGVVLVGGGWVFYLYENGALRHAVKCFFYILDYAKGPPGSDFTYIVLKFLLRTILMMLSGGILWYFALRRVWHHLSAWRTAPPRRLLLALWFLFTFVPVVIGGRMYFHYYILLFPPLCMLGGEGWRRFFDTIRKMRFEKGAWRLTLFIIAIFIPVCGFTAYATYKPFRPKHNDYWIYAVDYIQETTQKGDPIFVWGYCPQIYTVADRPPATRFTTADYLTGRTPKTAGLEFDPNKQEPSVWTKLKRDFVTPREIIDYDTSGNIFPGAWKLLEEDFQKTPPALIIDTSPSNYRLYGRYPLKKFPFLEEYVRKYYQFETSVRGMDIYRRK